MRNFNFHTPRSLDEALSLLSLHGEEARVIAGGTALVTLLKQSLVHADHIVSLMSVDGLHNIRYEHGKLHIGALVRHREVETSSLIQKHAPLVAECYSKVATIRIRNVATVGGGLAHADPAQDPPPGLIAMNATICLASVRGQRVIPVETLFTDYYETIIEPDEILTELIVPKPPPGARSAYLRYLPKTADDYPTVSVAVIARIKETMCQEIRVALGAIAPTPIRATTVEKTLHGQQINEQTIRYAAQEVANHIDPIDDPRGSAEYKRAMAVVFTRRALERALG